MKRKKLKKAKRHKSSVSGGKHLVKGHTRSPRGPDRGKKPVRVPPYRRKNP